MKRFISLALGALLFAFSVPAEAQQSARVYRIGYLSAQSLSAESSRLDAFRQTLRELGYVDQKNIMFEHRFAEGKFDRLPDLAAELVRLKVDLIVTTGSPATSAAQQATRLVPIVMTVVGDPVPKFVASLAKPGGNLTGLTQVAPQLSGKRVEVLKQAFPKISRVAVFDDPALSAEQMSMNLQETQIAAESLGMSVQSVKLVSTNLDLDRAFRTATSQRSDALIILPGPFLALHRKRVVNLAAKSRLPAIYPHAEFVDDGGLMFYGADFIDVFRRAATYVDKILRGTKPRDLPVEQPTRFELVINLKTAKQIGLTIPPTVLARADRVIR